MSEVDKFKRRVIRAVARLLRKDQTPGEEMWKALQNEAGCDCKLLWQRMRALTLKKMKRLILAEDRLANIASVAKMTLTDWLLFDLVLVHEDIDVIGQDLKNEPTMLTDLFNVVKRFQIEGKQGDALATAWTAATFYYNSFGRQCSPMLLQRRWYQLKKLARYNFYRFWGEYRGNARLLAVAKEFQPTKLQSDIAQRFPHLVTTPFLEWDKMIKDKWVILPEEFEAKIKKKNAKPKPATNEPDLVLLEPQIETIDLGVDSETECDPTDENSKDSSYNNNALNPVSLAAAIKKEPQDEFEMDFQDEFDLKALETTQIPDDDNAVDYNDENSIAASESFYNDVEMSDEVQEINAMPKICSVAGNFNEDSVTTELTDCSGENRNEVMNEIDNILKNAAEVRKERGNSVESNAIMGIGSNSKLHTRIKLDAKPTQIELATQPLHIDGSDDSFPDVSSRNEAMTEINSFLKSAAEVKKETHGKSIESSSDIKDPKSKLLKRTNLDAQPMQVVSAAQPTDVIESHNLVAGVSKRNDVMTKINNMLKSAAELKKQTRGGIIKTSSVLIGPKSKILKRTNLDTNPMQLESPEQPIDIDRSDIDSLAGDSSRNEVMTEINNILESAMKGKSKIHKITDKTLVTDGKLTNVNKSVAKLIEEITDTVEINDSLNEVDARDERVANINKNFTEIIDDTIEVLTDIKVEETPLEDVIKSKTSVPETSSTENEINDPSIDIPTDLTFEDDGIELVDDGIAFEDDNDYQTGKIVSIKSESESIASDNEEPAKFDLKLLMHPCVYTIKLEDMSVFKNKKIDAVRDKLSLDTALVESKMYVKQKQIEDTKDEQENESMKSENSTDNDSSDSEDGITESKKVNLSSYMLQKPKSRSYNPIQLCKNPDFNTRLKRLTVGFLSSNRNRLLLKCLKPMTIDLSKTFESKLINGTIYLKSDNSPKIKCEKRDDVSEEPNVTAVLPSAMPVQSLIDNSSLYLQDLLPSPPKLVTKPYELLSERHKPINLPDINNIRRINQHLLTAEVTPMRIQSNNKYLPPVQLVAAPKVNQLNSLEKGPNTDELRFVGIGTNSVVNYQIANSELIPKPKDAGNTDPISGSSTASGEKKKAKRSYYNLSWNSMKKIAPKPTIEDESLLTLDSLNKMLNLFNVEDSEGKSKTERAQKKIIKQQKMELQKRMDQFEKKIEDVPSEPETEVGAANNKKVLTDKAKEKKIEEPPPETFTPKINIVTDKPYGLYCCWARNKLVTEGKKAVRAHQCPRICRCCCRDELAKKLSRPTNHKLVKSSEIVISDDEENKKVCESIEAVVNQSRNIIRNRSLKLKEKTTGITTTQNIGKMRTEVSVQCDISSSSDFGKMNLASVVAAKSNVSTNKLKKSEVITINDTDDISQENKLKPVRVRKDLIMDTYKLPIPRVKHQAHITIDASKQNVHIHSEPVYFNTDGQDKILYLNSKQNSKDISSPIFLGENKILLTDIKFPSKDPTELMLQNNKPFVVPTTPAPSIPVAVPTTPCVTPLALPHGVQIILLPDGQLTYTIDPGAKLSEKELSSLPVILDAIRQQLNQTPDTNSEVINLTDEGGTEVPTPVIDPTVAAKGDFSDNTSGSIDVTSSSANVEIGSSDKTTIEKDKQKFSDGPSNIENSPEPMEKSNEKGIVVEKGAASTNKENDINVDSENSPLSTDITEGMKKVCEIDRTDNENTSSQEITDKISQNLKNTALVTGDETKTQIDMARQVNIESTAESLNVPENIPENPHELTNSTVNSNRKTLLSDLMEMSGISEEDIQTNVPANDENTTVQEDIVHAAPVPQSSIAAPDPIASSSHVPQVTASSAMPSIPELTPITSFSQLKYACAHNGRFFKLDLQLGTLTKIAVCIKKNKPKLPPRLMSKSVIDLTDDQDTPLDKATNPEKKRRTNQKQDVSLDETTLPAHVIQTNKDHVSLNEEIIPVSVIQTNRSLLKSNNTTDSVKPLKLFRAIRILKRNQNDTPKHLKVSADLGRGLLKTDTDNVERKRKQELDQPRVIVASSLESGLPTQEEVDESSLDSFELDQYIWKDPSDLVSTSDSDTSDDEPLAYKAKRMRVNESQPESSGVEINKEPVVGPKEVTITKEGNPQIDCEIEMINIERLPCETGNLEERFFGEKNIATEADIAKQKDITEEADTSEVMDGPEDSEITGVEEVPIRDDINMLPALQVVEPMDEDEDDDNCILGF